LFSRPVDEDGVARILEKSKTEAGSRTRLWSTINPQFAS
jgi:hypothetical protein